VKPTTFCEVLFKHEIEAGTPPYFWAVANQSHISGTARCIAKRLSNKVCDSHTRPTLNLFKTDASLSRTESSMSKTFSSD
jgi:hypothetical protein